ncbi:MAG: hypothetical protein HY226_03915 [Candidatus Vogelbacteria bacterium]|nr:hypothetical protein [Candidatus Vogelbacteria bacterium]
MKGESIVPESKVNTLSHLKPGVRPIMACVGERSHFKRGDYVGGGERMEIFQNYDLAANAAKNNTNVDYYGNPDELERNGFKNRGKGSFTISPVNNLDKFSGSYRNCTGVIVAGIDRKTGENISLLSHQDPEYFLTSDDQKQRFVTDLEERLEELKDRCESGTIDAIILGGNYFQDVNTHGRKYATDYLDSVKLLSSEITKTLGFEPTVITGPKMLGGDDNSFYDNKNRRLYLSRPKVGEASTGSYQSTDITHKEKEW